jgi:hypothetical protein
LKTGLSLAGCESAYAVGQTVAAAIAKDPALLDVERWADLRTVLLSNAVLVTEIQRGCERERVSYRAIPALATDWMDGVDVDELRHRHQGSLGTDDPMQFAAVLDRVVVHDLAWVLSAIVQLLEHELGKRLSGPINAAAAMAKYGVSTEPACYAASLGIRNRSDARALGALFPTFLGISFPLFLLWVAWLVPEEVAAHVSPDTAKLFLDRGASLLTPQAALDLLVMESGAVSVPLRGIKPMATAAIVQQLSVGADLILQREYGNPVDPNAIAVVTAGKAKVGYVAREFARVLAPLLDLEEGPSLTATLTALPAVSHGAGEDERHEALEGHDAVQMKIVVAHPAEDRGP